MRKQISMAREWAEEKLRALCGRISPARRNLTVLVMFGLFAAMALFIFCNAVYQIGKNEGAKIAVEHIKLLDITDNGQNTK